MKQLLLGLAFLLEVIAFIAFSAIGYALLHNHLLKLLVFVLLLVGLITFWSIYMAPKASRKLDPTKYYIAKAVIYAVSSISLYRLQSPATATTFVVLAILDELLLSRHNLEK